MKLEMPLDQNNISESIKAVAVHEGEFEAAARTADTSGMRH